MATDIKQKVLYELQVNGVDKSAEKMKELEGASDGVSESLGGVSPQAAIAAAAIVAATAAMVMLTKAAIDNANAMAGHGAAIYNSASAANVSIEEYQALNYVLRQTTGQLDGAAKQYRAINTFLLSATSATSLQGKALADLGLEYDAVFAMDPQARYIAITDAIGGLTDKTQQNTIAAGIFGSRYSAQVVGALNQAGGSMTGMMDTFTESNMILGDSSVAALKKYDDAITDFDMTIDKLKVDMALEVIPVLEKALITFRDSAPSIETLKNILGTAAITLGTFTAAQVINLAVTGQLTIATTLAAIAKTKLGVATIAAGKSMVGPAGMAAAVAFTTTQLVQLTKAMVDANNSMKANEEATRLAAEGNALVGDVMLSTMTAVGNGAELSAGQVEVLTNQIEAMGASEDVTADATRLLRAQLDGSIESIIFASNASENLTGKTEGLSLAMLDEAIAALEAEMAMKQLHAELSNGPTMIASELARSIAEAERLRGMMLDIKAGHDPNAGRSTPSPTAQPAPEPIPLPSMTPIDPFEVLGFGSLGDIESTYQEITMIAVNEEELKQEAIASIQADWRERYYDTYMEFSGDVVTTFVDSWANGFEDLDEMMKKMLQNWMKEMAVSGILTLFSQAAGGGAVGIFGKLLGAGGK